MIRYLLLGVVSHEKLILETACCCAFGVGNGRKFLLVQSTCGIAIANVKYLAKQMRERIQVSLAVGRWDSQLRAKEAAASANSLARSCG